MPQLNTDQTNTFDVFVNDEGNIRVVKRGFSWPAAMFNALWALYHNLWLISVAVVVAAFAGLLAFAATQPEATLIAGPGFLMLEAAALWFLGAHGNRWLARSLANRGYRLSSTVSARDANAARALASPNRAAA